MDNTNNNKQEATEELIETEKIAECLNIKSQSPGEVFKKPSDQPTSKLTKLNRSISSSILSINKFKRKKQCRQSIHTDQIVGIEQLNLVYTGSVAPNLAPRNSITSKNLLKQIENLHEQAGIFLSFFFGR